MTLLRELYDFAWGVCIFLFLAVAWFFNQKTTSNILSGLFVDMYNRGYLDEEPEPIED